MSNQNEPLSAEKRELLEAYQLPPAREISRDELLQINHEKATRGHINDLKANRLFNQIAFLQQQLEAQKEANRWVPVEERLPDANTPVEVFGTYTSALGGELTFSGVACVPSDLRIWRSEYGFMRTEITITHWRPRRTDTPTGETP